MVQTVDHYPLRPADVLATLQQLTRLRDEPQLAEILSRATPAIEATDYDNWNGGTTFYTLLLELTLEDFAAVESDADALESILGRRVALISKRTGNHVLNAVSLAPSVVAAGATADRPGVAPSDAARIWLPRRIRLFLSHVSQHKAAVAGLKRELEVRGATAFVAHADIEPTREWQSEIVMALESMDVMVALLTPEFHSSWWTDQEVGFALGRHVRVVSVRAGMTPYGFIGKDQGLPGDLQDSERLADGLTRLLLARSDTEEKMSAGLVTALESAQNFLAAKIVAGLLQLARVLSPEEIARISAASRDNDQVAKAFGVPEQLSQLVALHRRSAA